MFGQMLPHTGLYCVAKKLPKGFHHRFFTDIEEAKEYTLEEDGRGEEVYLAQSSFRTKESRKQENVHAVRSFWLDIDCGPNKPYADQGEGLIALREFCTKVPLPLPTVTNSGNGLYAHWVMDADITAQQWRDTACLLKSLMNKLNFHTDDSRTTDSSSVLRPPGTRNKKDPQHPKPVLTATEIAKDMHFATFRALLEASAAATGATIPAPKASSHSTLNAEFTIPFDGPPATALRVKDKCALLSQVATQQSDVPEPLWYAVLGLLRHCVDGHHYAHEWSKDHPEYDAEVTNRKLGQLERGGVGPATCEHLRGLNPVACLGCTHSVTSPIQLGKEYEKAEPTLVADEKPELPKGFSLTKHGLVLDAEEPILFYDQELYVTDLAWDESLGYETATIKHYLPHEGWNTFSLRSSLTNDSRGFHMAMADHHIKLVGGERKKAMLLYIESYLAKVQRAKKMAQLVCQMGWKDDGRFVLGRNVIMPDGEAQPVALAKSVPVSVEAFHTSGDLAPWVEATTIFDRSSGMLPLAFAFCAGAFGAPLMKFAGYPGAMVSMIGTSGVGKTLIGNMMLSTYGKPDRLMMLKDDTKNSLISRLGAYGNLPLYIDEVTNSNPEELSELTYRITQGRDKARLNRNATERTINNHWQTLALVSSNASITDKLSGMKQDASPELNRVLEFAVPSCGVLNRESATAIYRTITENYGHAGVEYIKYLVMNQEHHRQKIDKIVSLLDAQTNALNEERYWSAIAGVTLYGAVCAKKLGLIKFDVSKLFTWTVATIKTMQSTKKDVVNTALDSLGQMLDEFASHRLVIGKTDTCVVTPRASLFVRIETDTDFVFISRAKVQEWCVRCHASYTNVREGLEASGVLLHAGKRKVLGARTEWAGSQQPCWVLDLKSPHMGKYHELVTEELRKK